MTTTLGSILKGHGGSLQTGPFGTVLKAAEYSSTGVPVISVGEVGYGSLRLRPETPRVSLETADRLPAYVLRTGDIVFGRKGGVDRSAWVRDSEDGWFLGSDGIRVRLSPQVDSRFIAFQLRTVEVKTWLLQHAAGSTMPSLNEGVLTRVPIRLPVLSEQRAIVEVLGVLDDKIAANAKLVETIDEYLAAELTAALACGAESVVLSSIADVNRNVMKPNPGGQLRYVDIAGVGVGHFVFPELSNWDSAPSRARRLLSRGDTVWSTVRPNRRSHALNLSDDSRLIGSTGLAVISPRETGFAYLYEVTRLPAFTSFLESAADGSAYPVVRAERFNAAPVPLPPKAARDKFENVAAPMRELVHSLAAEDRTLATIRDALLPALMSGRLRVKDAERQVEAVV